MVKIEEISEAAIVFEGRNHKPMDGIKHSADLDIAG